MNDLAIRVEGLSKRYRIGTRRAAYGTLRDTLTDAMYAPFRAARRLFTPASLPQAPGPMPHAPCSVPHAPPPSDHIWALKDISFEVKRGEVVGIIGRNGAGKSTLLKILSRITEPTEGFADIYGRVGSLLEVGTGFHPELTGRENVYLNGAILGMKRWEIAKKFDEIVAFAEVEKFLDTPVKFYSSGMYVRLAFAVAAHLEPEILLVDEVLAVGDVAFQKKCLGKMEDVAAHGRTVLFVSHNMQTVRALCPRSILLCAGRLFSDGRTCDTAERYQASLREQKVNASTDVNNPENRRGSGAARLTKIRVETLQGNECFRFMMGNTIRFVMHYRISAPVQNLIACVLLRSGVSREVVTCATHLVVDHALPAGATGAVAIVFPNICLRPGEYPLYFSLSDSNRRSLDIVDDLTCPLTVYPEKDLPRLDIDPTRHSGYFNIESELIHLSSEEPCQ